MCGITDREFPEAQRAISASRSIARMPRVNRETGGTGLGLYLARQIARAHGGDLELRDVTGRGALFVVSLPLHAGP